MEFEIPEELMYEILIKLPVKALLRFRCVCKTWNSLITSSGFILSHLHYNELFREYNLLFKQLFSVPNNSMIMHDSQSREKYSIHADNDQFQEIETLVSPFNGLSIVGCVNGLVCLRKDDRCAKSNFVMLWNPSIRKYFILPQLEEPISQKPYDFEMFNKCFGFGYDSSSDDFKVVRMVDSPEHLGASNLSLVKVFSLHAKSWRTLDCSPPRGLCYSTCNVGDFVYNLYYMQSTRDLEIVSFDLRAEVFTKIEYPKDSILAPLYRTIKLTNFRDNVALIRREWKGDEFHIWCMRDDGVSKSWIMLFLVNIERASVWQSIAGFSAKGRMLVVGYCNVTVLPAAEDAHVVKYVPPRRDFQCSSRLELFKESLVLLGEGDDVHGSKKPFRLQEGDDVHCSKKPFQSRSRKRPR